MSNFKIAVTVPHKDANILREAIGKAGGGKVGNYTYCSFTTRGIGRFIPDDSANPAIGETNKLEEVDEDRIEINCDEASLKAVLAAIRQSHPYEQPVIDVYKLEDYEN